RQSLGLDVRVLKGVGIEVEIAEAAGCGDTDMRHILDDDRFYGVGREDEFRANGFTTQEFDGETGTLETVDDNESYVDEDVYVDEEPLVDEPQAAEETTNAE
ncbi:MAG: hypothetical protein K6E90_05650, partial [Lachnospiraceae bacterium]|nr:hypothetical protein [Lachnospiraceae bacterium]